MNLLRTMVAILLTSTLIWACDPPTPPKPSPPVDPPTTVTNTQSQNQAQNQKQGQTQTANGGSASSTSNATGGNSSVKGSGNSSVSNSTYVAAPKIPVSTAVAPPVLPTVPCFKGAGGALQMGMVGGAFGGGKVDSGCDDRELARAFSGPQTIASCKILIATKKAKKAGVTMEDCMGPKPEPIAAPAIEDTPAPTLATPISVVVPVTIISPPEKTAVKIHKAAPKKKVVIKKTCVTQNWEVTFCKYEK